MIVCPLSGTDIVITQGFGLNPQRYAKYGINGHPGIDLRCPIGTGLYAPCEGYVHYGDQGNMAYGKFATITSLPYLNNGTRRQITLGHLSRFLWGLEGQFVHVGDLVGYSGNTGDSTAPHCHITYKKLDASGNVLNDWNGFHGAIDITPYIQLWVEGQHL